MLIQGKSIILRALDVEDYAAFLKWSQKREVTQYSLSSYAYPQSPTDIKKWLSGINSTPKTVTFGIACAATDQLIGYAGIADISHLNRSGEFFILIGDQAFWGKGVGTEVTRLVTEYGLKTLGLHRIMLTAFSENIGAIRAYEKAGYVQEGVLRQSGFRAGKFLDKVVMSVLADEWQGGRAETT